MSISSLINNIHFPLMIKASFLLIEIFEGDSHYALI